MVRLFLPLSEQLETELAAKDAVAPSVAGEESHGKHSSREAVAHLDVDVEALHLDVVASPRHPGEKEQRGLVGEVHAEIIVRTLIGGGAQQLELSAPVVIPSAGDIVFPKVFIAEEISSLPLGRVEAESAMGLQRLQSVEPVDVFSVHLPTLIERPVIVNGEDRSVPSAGPVLQLHGRGEGSVGVRPSKPSEFQFVDSGSLLKEQSQLYAENAVGVVVEHQSSVGLPEFMEAVENRGELAGVGQFFLDVIPYLVAMDVVAVSYL